VHIIFSAGWLDMLIIIIHKSCWRDIICDTLQGGYYIYMLDISYVAACRGLYAFQFKRGYYRLLIILIIYMHPE
jgi:hypothetical protein